MPEVKITNEEAEILILIKKNQLKYKDCDNLVKLFCVALENKLFDFPKGYAGEKIIRWDKDGNMRQIETHKIDWKG